MPAQELYIYNSLSRRKELFTPLHAPRVGLYVCGPTVYGDAHLGHARPAVTFDVLFRLLSALGYQVRYVRNITDVGHLEHDADEGEDKIAKRARLEQLEPMELAHRYTERYHEAMRALNTLSPSIEPLASGHIIEQIGLIQKILDAGYAYVVDGNVYFDIEHYDKAHQYGILSGRRPEDMVANTRVLEGQEGKRHPLDFALWKKASAVHIMRWPSPWGEGFPGWHLECSAMSTKYLGETFDIHGGGLDLLFPHHECEIAQSVAASGHQAVRYWMHNNLITIEGQKIGKSLGNFIQLHELFSGNHPKLERAYSPMTVRFFILQAHYRSTLDFSNAALLAASKGLERLWEAMQTLERITPSEQTTIQVQELEDACWNALLDDMNTPIAIAHLFEWVRVIGHLQRGEERITPEELARLRAFFSLMVYDILGLQDEGTGKEGGVKEQAALDTAMQLALEYRAEAKGRKDYTTADRIRNTLNDAGVEVMDGPQGVNWRLK